VNHVMALCTRRKAIQYHSSKKKTCELAYLVIIEKFLTTTNEKAYFKNGLSSFLYNRMST
jgi:hypothetical protein